MTAYCFHVNEAGRMVVVEKDQYGKTLNTNVGINSDEALNPIKTRLLLEFHKK